MVRNIRRRRVLYLSGWALRAASRAEFDADGLLPFSDHADFDELLRHIEEVAAETIVATHGFARDFARILSARGLRALPLLKPSELPADDA
jgi:Cft2 family RNA processing exonuclease